MCLKVVTHPITNPTRLGLTSELVCLLSLLSAKTSYSLVAVDTCTHWVPIFDIAEESSFSCVKKGAIRKHGSKRYDISLVMERSGVEREMIS